MNALTPFYFDSQHPGQKDPTTLTWPPTLPIELALKTAPPAAIQVEYGYSDADWAALKHNEAFLKELAGACELVRQEGMSFKLKAKLIAEENLKSVWKLIHSSTDEVPATVKAKLIELTARWAGFDPRNNGEGDAAGPLNANTLNIQINLGTDY